MRQLFVFETVDGDDRVAEIACLAVSEQEALEMLVAEGYEGSLLGAVALGGEPFRARRPEDQSASETDVAWPDDIGEVPEATAPLEVQSTDGSQIGDNMGAVAEESGTQPVSAEPGSDQDVTPTVPPLTGLHIVARDYAMVSVYAVGLDVASVAGAVGVTPREAARRLAFHLLGTVDEGSQRADASRMVLEIDERLASVADLYLGGMSITEMADALGHSGSDVVWALLDAPSRVVAVTPAVLRSLRSDLDIRRGVAAR
ncbi:hypothetical protein [Microbacterium sp. P5_E9]